jgi:hypothetical protein
LLPCSSLPADKNEPFAALSPAVSPTLRPLGPVAWIPCQLWVPFQRTSRLPVAPDHERLNRPVPSASPASKPYSPCESVPIDRSFPMPMVATLLDSYPSEAFSAHALGPQTRPNASARTCLEQPNASARTLETRPQGPRDPWCQVKSNRPPEGERRFFVGRTRSSSRPDRTASRRRPCSHDLSQDKPNWSTERQST